MHGGGGMHTCVCTPGWAMSAGVPRAQQCARRPVCVCVSVSTWGVTVPSISVQHSTDAAETFLVKGRGRWRKGLAHLFLLSLVWRES